MYRSVEPRPGFFVQLASCQPHTACCVPLPTAEPSRYPPNRRWQVCISYGDLRPDESLLYYGFLPPIEAAAAVAVAEAAAEAAAPGGGDDTAEAFGRQQCSAAAGESVAAALPGGGSSSGGGGSSSSGREGSCEWDGGADPALRPGLQLLPLAAVDEAQYDSAARPGKGSYSRLGMQDEGADEGQGEEGAASRGLQRVEAVEAEAKRLKARLAEVVAKAAAAWAGPAAGGNQREGARFEDQVQVHFTSECTGGRGKPLSCAHMNAYTLSCMCPNLVLS